MGPKRRYFGTQSLTGQYIATIMRPTPSAFNVSNAIHLMTKLNLNLHRRGLNLAMLPDDMKHLINYDEKIIWALRGDEVVVVSNQRLIIRKSGSLGLKKSFVDYPYSNMVNVRLDKGVRRSSVEILMRSGVQNVKIGGLSKGDAYQLHRIVRENIIRSSETQPGHPFPVIISKTDPLQKDHHKCTKCGNNVSRDFSLCPYCGYALKLECPECGKNFDRKFKICPYCGEDLTPIELDLEF